MRRAPRGRRRSHALSVLAAIPLLVAACGGQAPSGAPSASIATAGPSPSPTSPTGRTPDPGCPILDEGYVSPEVEFTPLIGRFGMQPKVTQLVPAWDPATPFTPATGDQQSYSGVLPGGHDVPVELWLFYPDFEPLGTPAILSVEPSIAVGSGPAQPLELSVVETLETYWLLNVRGIPDADGPARLDVTVEWRDACFTYTAEGSVEVSLVGTTATGSCPLDPEGFYRQLAEVEFAQPLEVGDAEVDLMGRLPIARYLPEGPPSGDGPTPFQLWDRTAAAVTGAPGAALPVSEANDRVELTTMDASFYARGEVIKSLDKGKPASPSRVFHRAPDRRADGTFRLRLPAAAGRYVVWLQFEFQSTCATGRAWAVFGVDVAAPTATPEPSPTPDASAEP